MVVIAIIAVLIGLLLPAVQKVREAASRAQGLNNLKQIALATHGYHDVNLTFPGATYLYNGPFPIGPPMQGYTVFVSPLPYLEQQNLFQAWNFTAPLLNGQQTAAVPGPPGATVLKVLVCPSDVIPQNPNQAVKHPPGTYLWGITSYGGNGGSQSYPNASFDGMFYAVGPATSPVRFPARIASVTDGLSNTLMFGERYHLDHNFDALVSPVPSALSTDLISSYGWWGSHTPEATADITESACAPLNYLVPSPLPPGVSAQQVVNLRIYAWGSGHTNGANFALGDGSIRFIGDSISQSTLVWMSTCSGGEIIPDY